MLRAAFKLFLLACWLVLLYFPVLIASKLGWKQHYGRLTTLFYKGFLHIVGIRLKITGDLSYERPLLLVTNHLSYLDIPILGSQFPVVFTPKGEMAKWPLIGAMCKLTRCVFIVRKNHAIKTNQEQILQHLLAGDVVALFPESTTGNGIQILDFRSSFFTLAEDDKSRSLFIQPAAIIYTHLQQIPIDSTQWPQLAWYGDMDLLPHAWNLLQMGPINAHLVFLPPVTIEHYGDRKSLAIYCRQAIEKQLMDSRATANNVPQKRRMSLTSKLSKLTS